MILILSQSSFEPTTEEVMDWLEHLGAPHLRLNGDDLDGRADLDLELRGDQATLCLEARADGRRIEVDPAAVAAVWFRRWHGERRHEGADLLVPPAVGREPGAPGLPAAPDTPPRRGAPAADAGASERERLQFEIKRHLSLESARLDGFLFARLDGAAWLTDPRTSGVNKLEVLQRAARCGLATPATLVTTRRASLRRFAEGHGGALITKPISEPRFFHLGGCTHTMYTAALDLSTIDALPERFAASLFQERLDKEYELRVFYLAGDCSAMAIFSQSDPLTRTDFRRAGRTRPNRSVPYLLPAPLAARIDVLMRDLGHETGSLDLVYTRDGREVFLEVNPVGQFGMMSKPCNYPLERQVAELLVAKAAHAGGPHA